MKWFDHNKFERQEILSEFKLNVPDNSLVTTMDELDRIDLSQHPGWSIRTMCQKGQKYDNIRIMATLNSLILPDYINHIDISFPPHLYDFPVAGVPLVVKFLLSENFDVIVMPGINIEDCQFAGAIWKVTNTNMVIELIDGPYSVREVTTMGRISRRYVWPKQQIDDLKVRRAIGKLQTIPIENAIFEFSFYNKPVGKLNEKLIFWDYLPANKYTQQKRITVVKNERY